MWIRWKRAVGSAILAWFPALVCATSLVECAPPDCENDCANVRPAGRHPTLTTVASSTTIPSTDVDMAHPGTTPGSNPFFIGANVHGGGSDVISSQKIADTLSSRHLNGVRMDFTVDTNLAVFRDQVTRLHDKGIQAETSLQITYQWDHSCNQNFDQVQQDSYAQTLVLIRRVDDLIQDFELLNEISLRPDTSSQVEPFKGAPASAYAGKSCYATFAAVLRGMSKAVVDERNTTGMPLRVILGTVSNDFGFLEFMGQQGVVFDVVGYHTYPSLSMQVLGQDPWYGAGGALVQLAKFGKPVHINEFNCGEIYSGSYENAVGQPTTDTCLSGINKHLASLLNQSTINLESIHAYELLDDPGKAGAEGRFGLMYNLDMPKLHLALYSAFAGGFVSVDEKAQLDARSLKSQ